MKKIYGLLPILLMANLATADEKPSRPIDGIMDNSFLVEEAYNQEEGVVQHIFTATYSREKFIRGGERALDFSFTQEWPVPNQTHQLSYTVPYSAVWNGGSSANGVGDVLLNYRYQAYFNEQSLTAFAPRMSLVLPTGDASRGFGNDTLGYQFNLPFSTTLNDRWFIHANAGLTFLPRASATPRRDLLDYNVGASAIYCVNDRLHLMLEWVGNWSETPVGSSGTDRDFSSLISPGLRYAFNFKNDSQLVLGLAAPIGVTRNTPDAGIFLYASFEHFFKRKAK